MRESVHIFTLVGAAGMQLIPQYTGCKQQGRDPNLTSCDWDLACLLCYQGGQGAIFKMAYIA